ncbi:hypothetical protein BCAH1134_C0215 (plasmid) [Bacillus cereus AH1134]|nr:hypothetical protein BCAH1134_C0215 [Bacillus cereus AH1134]
MKLYVKFFNLDEDLYVNPFQRNYICYRFNILHKVIYIN